MAKNTTAAATATDAAATNSVAKVVTTTEAEKQKDQSPVSASLVPVASLLQRGYTFRNLKTAPGGRYTIPGKDFDKRGVAGNGKHLMLPGGAIFVRVPKEVWDEIKTTKQHLHIFKHQPAYLQELKREEDFNAMTRSGEFAGVRTGFEPITPQQAGVR